LAGTGRRIEAQQLAGPGLTTPSSHEGSAPDHLGDSGGPLGSGTLLVARAGGSDVPKAFLRLWGALAIALAATIRTLFGTAVG
jgi:hypothetical protein